MKLCVIYLTKKHILPASQTVATALIMPKICQCQPPTIKSQSNLVGFAASSVPVCARFVSRACLGRGRPLLNSSMNTIRSQVLPVIRDLRFVTVLTKVYRECQAAWCSHCSWNCRLRVSFISAVLLSFCYNNKTSNSDAVYLVTAHTRVEHSPNFSDSDSTTSLTIISDHFVDVMP